MMGLPNATSVQQEKKDALYSPFKSSMYACGAKVVQHKLRIRGLARRNGDKLPPAVLNLDFNNLATIVNGRPKDLARDRPFNFNFMKEKILWLRAKVGFVPFTRNCLHNKRVRKELEQRNKDEGLENLQLRYDILVDSVEENGFNPGIFDAAIPTAAQVKRAETEEEQVEELIKAGVFSASGQWNHCESRIGNAGVTLRAQKRQLKINENARMMVADKKSEAQLRAREKAQSALDKFKFDSGSMNDKDWGDVI